MIVLTLLAAVLSGVVGTSVDTGLLVYSDAAANITIQNQTYAVVPGTNTIPVSFPAAAGTHEQELIVTANQVTYTLPVMIIGKRTYGWLWWLSVIPVLTLLGAFRFRRIRAGSS